MAIKNIVHGKEYVDNRTGETKRKWTQVGILIEKDGKQYVKIEMLPVACEEDGSFFFSVFDQDHNRKPAFPDQQAADVDLEDDIPF